MTIHKRVVWECGKFIFVRTLNTFNNTATHYGSILPCQWEYWW